MTDERAAALKPCPLCHMENVEYHPGNSMYHGEVVCPDCGLVLTNNISGGSAVTRWNTRAESAVARLTARVAELEDLVITLGQGLLVLRNMCRAGKLKLGEDRAVELLEVIRPITTGRTLGCE